MINKDRTLKSDETIDETIEHIFGLFQRLLWFRPFTLMEHKDVQTYQLTSKHKAKRNSANYEICHPWLYRNQRKFGQ